MTDAERLWAGITLSLFLHFSLTFIHAPGGEERAAFPVVVELSGAVALPAGAEGQSTSLHAVSSAGREEAERLGRKRRAYLRYLEDVDSAVHARRLAQGENRLIGTALCTFIIEADGTFSGVALAVSSGTPALDASALRAVRAASGAVRRPAILGREPIRVSLPVKYQYALD